jgi:hypothetical protein
MKKPTQPKTFLLGEPPKENETKKTLSDPALIPTSTESKIDGRTLRRTGRTAQFNVMLSPEFRDQIAQTAEFDRLTYPQLLAVMFRAYSELSPEVKHDYITDVMENWGK